MMAEHVTCLTKGPSDGQDAGPSTGGSTEHVTCLTKGPSDGQDAGPSTGGSRGTADKKESPSAESGDLVKCYRIQRAFIHI